VSDNGAYDYGCLCCGWMLAFEADEVAEAAGDDTDTAPPPGAPADETGTDPGTPKRQ
jgi:hypothetical protein